MSSVTLKNAMNMSFGYEHVDCGYDLVVMIQASQACCSGSNPGIRIYHVFAYLLCRLGLNIVIENFKYKTVVLKV